MTRFAFLTNGGGVDFCYILGTENLLVLSQKKVDSTLNYVKMII